MADDFRRPGSFDEDLLEAEVAEVLSLESDQQRVERIAREFATGFAALAHVGPAVSFFGSARSPRGSPEYESARALARRLGEAGFAIITGGGPGIMEAGNRGAREAGALSIGLRIDLPFEAGINDFVDIPLDFHFFFARKVMFVRYASAFVVFPGGYGTADELFEALTLIQTDKIRYFPVILLGSDYWRGLVDWLRERALAEGKISEEDMGLFHVCDDHEAVLEIVQSVAHRQARRRPPAASAGS
ncbi:MAG: TIGR00730 family Rossman fold protein [Thermoleophilaceae bacterium]|nr:TIGR00730 family Rossman fold protein [Thermoleophilaceae bacterium]